MVIFYSYVILPEGKQLLVMTVLFIGIIRLEAFGTQNLRHVTDNTEEDPLAG